MTQATFTRRTLLRFGAATVALATLPLRILDVFADSGTTTGTNTWTYSQWSGLVGSAFTATQGDGSTAQLSLVGATNLMPPGSATDSGPQIFSLVFSGAATSSPGDALRTLCNDQVGSVPMLLVAGAAAPDAQHYEAVVNRI